VIPLLYPLSGDQSLPTRRIGPGNLGEPNFPGPRCYTLNLGHTVLEYHTGIGCSVLNPVFAGLAKVENGKWTKWSRGSYWMIESQSLVGLLSRGGYPRVRSPRRRSFGQSARG